MTTELIVVDAGPLVAVFSAADSAHDRCSAAFQALVRPPITCWPVLVEAAYLLRKQPHFVESLLATVERGGLEIDPLTEANTVPMVRSLMSRYGPSGLQVADACLISVALRRNIKTVLTIDHRDFGMISAQDGGPFRIIPD